MSYVIPLTETFNLTPHMLSGLTLNLTQSMTHNDYLMIRTTKPFLFVPHDSPRQDRKFDTLHALGVTSNFNII